MRFAAPSNEQFGAAAAEPGALRRLLIAVYMARGVLKSDEARRRCQIRNLKQRSRTTAPFLAQGAKSRDLPHAHRLPPTDRCP
jgi:hypothetical protein